MEHRRFVEVLNYQVTMRCDFCDKGDMEYIEDNIYIATDPPLYRHKCNRCEAVKSYQKRYPYIEQRVLHIPMK